MKFLLCILITAEKQQEQKESSEWKLSQLVQHHSSIFFNYFPSPKSSKCNNPSKSLFIQSGINRYKKDLVREILCQQKQFFSTIVESRIKDETNFEASSQQYLRTYEKVTYVMRWRRDNFRQEKRRQYFKYSPRQSEKSLRSRIVAWIASRERKMPEYLMPKLGIQKEIQELQQQKINILQNTKSVKQQQQSQQQLFCFSLEIYFQIILFKNFLVISYEFFSFNFRGFYFFGVDQKPSENFSSLFYDSNMQRITSEIIFFNKLKYKLKITVA